MLRALLLLLLLVWLGVGTPRPDTDVVWDFSALLGHAMYPSQGVQAKIHTSYDRRLRNTEFNHFLEERILAGQRQLVFFSEMGPGCIRSLWLLDDLENLRLHLYIDDMEVSVPEIPAFGHHPLFPFPLAGTNARGGKKLQRPGVWSFVPLVFHQRCVMAVSLRSGQLPEGILGELEREVEEDLPFRFLKMMHWVTYHTFAQPLRVSAFQGSQTDVNAAAAAAVATAHPRPFVLPTAADPSLHRFVARGGAVTGNISVPAGGSEGLVAVAFCFIGRWDARPTIELMFDNDPQFVVNMSLHALMAYNDQARSKVVGWGNASHSPCRIPNNDTNDRHAWLTLPMPFQHQLVLRCSGVPEVRVMVAALAPRWPAHGFGYFHAQEHITPQPSLFDLVQLADVSGGAGSFVGLWLFIRRAQLPVQEGDQFLQWDGARSAQVMGTGMEDLFFCGHSCHVCEDSCGMPFHGLAYKRKGPQRLMRTWVWYRHFLTDFIPFHDGFQMDLQVDEPMQANLTDLPLSPGPQAESYNAVALFYRFPSVRGRPQLQHLFDATDPEAAAAHHLTEGPEPSWVENVAAHFEGPTALYGAGRQLNATHLDAPPVHRLRHRNCSNDSFVNFMVPVALAEEVILRRTLDFRHGPQVAEVFIGDRLAGVWHTADHNRHFALREADFPLPHPLLPALPATVALSLRPFCMWGRFHRWTYGQFSLLLVRH